MTGPQPDPLDFAPLDDSGSGLTMFLIFTAAVLIITGAVALMALVGTWWTLGVAFATHIVMTIIVMGTIWTVMKDRRGRSDA